MEKSKKLTGIIAAAVIVTGTTMAILGGNAETQMRAAAGDIQTEEITSSITESTGLVASYIAKINQAEKLPVGQMQNTGKTSTDSVIDQSQAEQKSIKPVKPVPVLDVQNLKAEAVSVSCIKITWDADPDRIYDFEIQTDAAYPENIHFVNASTGVCYYTGLRENSVYDITIVPELKENEEAEPVYSTVRARTQSVEIVYEYPYEDGWTGCFAGERASGLTAMPSSGAIAGSYMDDITGTTIRRKSNGDYCVAMGLFYGRVGDRFLIEMENGNQFTVQICDSKGWCDAGDGDGEGHYHYFGGSGKCIVEFIYDSDVNLPNCVRVSGSWGGYNWNGLDLGGNIKSIKLINY